MKIFIVKALSLFVFLFVLSFSAVSQQREGAVLEYVKESEELGKIFVERVEPVRLDVEFINEGDEPLLISSVRACCGTRVKSYPKEPLMPGEKGIVEVEFRLAARPHQINRRVSIMSNDERGMQVFRIKGEVVAEEESADAFGSRMQNSTAGPRVD